MKTIENSTQANIAATGDAKRGDEHVLQELWAIKAQLNRQANYDLATLAVRSNATAIRLRFSGTRVKTLGGASPKLNLTEVASVVCTVNPDY